MVDCTECGVSILRKNISRHMSSKHTESSPSVCQYCKKIFKTHWSLQEHERKQHGVLQSQKYA